MQSYRRSVPNNAIARSAYPDHGRHRRPYVSPYHTRYPYLLATPYGWIGSDYLGYPDDSDASAAPADNAGPYDAQLPEPDQLAGNPPYMPQMQSLSPPPVPLTQDAVTLVYKDGRPAEQIHNFVLTPTTLYVQDQQGRSIRVDQLDLEATAKANQEAGVSFQLPDASR